MRVIGGAERSVDDGQLGSMIDTTGGNAVHPAKTPVVKRHVHESPPSVMGKSIGVQTTLNFFIGRGQKDMKTLAIIFRQRPQLQGSIGQKNRLGLQI